MTDKEIVLAKFPDAYERFEDGIATEEGYRFVVIARWNGNDVHRLGNSFEPHRILEAWSSAKFCQSL